LLRTDYLNLSYPADRTAGWGKLAPQIEVHELPGNHDTCLTEHIGVVVDHIRKCLPTFNTEAQSAMARSRYS
jgi:hypothetical protein